MKLIVLILKEEEILDKFIKKCTSMNIKNITVLESNSYECDSTGSKRKNNANILNSIRYMLDYYNDESRTILIPVNDEKYVEVKDIIKNLVPSNQYTLMAINIEEIIGLEK
jgi:nitrogen regulatory protein PII-like uncharacterized protein